MDNSGAYKNVKFTKPDSQTPSGDEHDVSYVELQFKTLSAPRVRRNGDSLTSTYSELKFGKDETIIYEHEDPSIVSRAGKLRVNGQTDGLTSTYSLLSFRKDDFCFDVYEDPPTASGHAELPVTAQTAAYEQQSKVKIGNRPNRLICLLCLVTSVLIVIVTSLSIHGIHINLRQQFSDMETKNRSVNETKAQICELLTNRSDETCSQDWIRNEDCWYFISTLETSYEEAKERCSNFDARLLEINSKQEENAVSNALAHPFRTYRIGKCKDGEQASSLMYKDYTGAPFCVNCDSYERRELCKGLHRFICEKRAYLFSDLC